MSETLTRNQTDFSQVEIDSRFARLMGDLSDNWPTQDQIPDDGINLDFLDRPSSSDSIFQSHFDTEPTQRSNDVARPIARTALKSLDTSNWSYGSQTLQREQTRYNAPETDQGPFVPAREAAQDRSVITPVETTPKPERQTQRKRIMLAVASLALSATVLLGSQLEAKSKVTAAAMPKIEQQTTITTLPTTTTEAPTTTTLPPTTTTLEVTTTTTAPAPQPEVVITYSGTAAENQALAHQMAREAGMDDAQIECMDNIVARESSYNARAVNDAERNNDLNRNKSLDFEAGEQISDTEKDAYGIPQALPGGKMASMGEDWRTNPATQIRWMFSYVQSRYGSMCNAWAEKARKGWY